jgi:hypothetical protein
MTEQEKHKKHTILYGAAEKRIISLRKNNLKVKYMIVSLLSLRCPYAFNLEGEGGGKRTGRQAGPSVS